jgi:hypothetical protein
MTMRVLAGAVGMLAVSWLLYSYYDRFWYPPDEGNYAHVAQRILDGETLNLEVQDVHPGYISFVNAAALRVFGEDLVSLRYPLVLAGLVQAAVLFLVFPRDDPWRAAVAIAALTALGTIQFLNPTAHWYCLALVILLIAALRTGPQSAGQLLAAGLLIGAIALFRQLTGFLAGLGGLTFILWQMGERGTHGREALVGRALAIGMAAALSLYLLLKTDISGIVLFGIWPLALLALLAMRPQAHNRDVARIVATIATGVAISTLPLVAYHVWHGSIRAWADDMGPAAVALTRMDFFERSNFGALVAYAAGQIATARDLPSIINGLYWAVLPLLAAVNGMVVVRMLRRGRIDRNAPLPIMSVFYAVVSVHFQIPLYLYYSVGLSLASLLWLAPHVSPTVARASIAVALLLAATGVYFQAGQPASRGITGILRGERARGFGEAPLPHSSLRIDPEDARRYRAVVELICRTVPAGDAIFALPSNAELYFLSQRRNAFRFYNTALGVRSDEDLAAVERTLRDHPPRLVTFNREDKYNTPRSWQIMESVKRRYVLLGRFEPFDVYVLP